MKFSLVMPCFRCEDTIKKAIDSIIDQDEKDWELICVVNGEWDGRTKLITILGDYSQKDKRIIFISQKEGNACSARNAGAMLAKGEYISFFSSDFYMFPGALRRWEKEFKAHPEADFIYSGYRLMKDGVMQTEYCPSRPFDAWELQIENYIDGGFPMRRKVWEAGKWDAAVKSLNDWDFWLTAIDNGFKGYFMPDPTYAAEIPKPGGLSYDSHSHWLERTEQIKKKHGIPIRDICVVSLGAQPHAKRIAKLLDADFKVAPQMKPSNYKAVYLVGFYIGDGTSAIAHSQVFQNHSGVKIIHWIGTDILQLIGAAYKVCYFDMKKLMDVFDGCVNLSEFDKTKGELASLGIKSTPVALPLETTYKVMPLPKKFTVAVYAPKTPTSAQIYNLDFMKDVIKSSPDIQFILFGGGMTDFKSPNCENVGWVPIKEVIEKTSCLLRITYHDGLPVAPIEWRLAGRDAITSVQMKYIHFAGDGIITEKNHAEKKEKLVWLLRQVKKEQKKLGVKDIAKARKYYLELTDPKAFKEKIREMIDESIRSRTRLSKKRP